MIQFAHGANLFAGFLFLLCEIVLAQSSPNYLIRESATAQGGAVSGSKSYLARDVIGQPGVTGESFSTNYRNQQGFLVGTLTLSNCLLGDVNMDNTITVDDALCAFQIYMNGGVPPSGSCETVCAIAASDANCDQSVNTDDALIIFLASLSNLTPPLDCPPVSKSIKSEVRHLFINEFHGAPSETVIANVFLANPHNLKSFGVDIKYPTHLLDFVEVIPSEPTHDWTRLQGQKIAKDVIRIGGFNAKGIESQKAAAIAQIIFTVHEKAQGAGELFLINPVSEFSTAQLISGKFSCISDGIRALYCEQLPDDYNLKQNYPNPFNLQTEIIYELPESAHINLSIYNSLGQHIRTIISLKSEAGIYAVSWDGLNESGLEVPSGIYIYRLVTPNYTMVKKMILLK